MSKPLLGIIAVALAISLVSGCTLSPQADENKTNVYTISVVKGPTNVAIYTQTLDTKEVNLQTLMSEFSKSNPDFTFVTGIEPMYSTSDKVVTELLGVVNTTGKQWHLYVDTNKKSEIEWSKINVTSNSKIEWKYEE